ncbi:beta-ketoacyl synthase N-terminal-like domain-containing protein [Streptomyces afghaniensis]|uniref:beta-ketoacyl synthase N-terminal-like domain-containing protein n=1 Tax=Streptomyces afghaniensis TaxID=66865 RepID=UPI00278937EC|nr:beta-ketoacyl synthase N-terminal-like domain-containing protein [Streptomyces afghaniensis]MDQ1018920.1 3-oxoacyl-[acyl-carrier-protein] synthase II [Streptomyces afghaniensis]
MTSVIITGVGTMRPGPARDTDQIAPDPLPFTRTHQVADFDPRAALGRKVARFNHRSTLLAMAAFDRAIEDAELEVTDSNRDQVGITMGTTLGSISGTVQFGMDSFGKERPYVVDAACFPNTVLNTAAAALAIRTGMRGPNTTVAAGPLAGVTALRHAHVVLRSEHADTVLAGASEEVTPPTAWWAATARRTGAPGEGAAIFVLERQEVAEAAGRAPLARLASTIVRSVDPADPVAIASVVAEALRRANVTADDVIVAAARATGVPVVDDAQHTGLTRLFQVPLSWHEPDIGDCYSAHSALQLAASIEFLRSDAVGTPCGCIIAVDPDGAVGVAVVQVSGG